LQYVGSAPSSTNRLVTLGTTASISSNSALPANSVTFANTGPVAFVSPGIASALVLSGPNTGNNTFANTITDSGGAAVILVKSGTGKWIVSGANTYSGGTGVVGGMLVLGADNALGTGPLQFGDVTLAPTATGGVDLATFNQTVSSLLVRSNSAN